MQTIPWAFRGFIWYVKHPLVGYFVVLILGLCWANMPRSPEATMLSAFVLPWFTVGIILLNPPLLGGMVRKLSLPLSTRRNHALEHGTIRLMAAKGIGGKAARDGFRVSGARSEAGTA